MRKPRRRKIAENLITEFNFIERVSRCRASEPSGRKRRDTESAFCYAALFYFYLLLLYSYYYYYMTQHSIIVKRIEKTVLLYYYLDGSSTRYSKPRELGKVQFFIRAPNAIGKHYDTTNSDHTDTQNAGESSELYFCFICIQNIFYLSEREKPYATADLLFSFNDSLRAKGEPMHCIQSAPRKRESVEIKRLILFNIYYFNLRASKDRRSDSAEVRRYLITMYICKLACMSYESDYVNKLMNATREKVTGVRRCHEHGGRRQTAAGLAEGTRGGDDTGRQV